MSSSCTSQPDRKPGGREKGGGRNAAASSYRIQNRKSKMFLHEFDLGGGDTKEPPYSVYVLKLDGKERDLHFCSLQKLFGGKLINQCTLSLRIYFEKIK